MSSNFSTEKMFLNKAFSGPILAKKSLGQNFLQDKNIINKIIASAGITKNDNILEIGPGQGALTFLLAYHANKVIAIEKDDDLSQLLKKTIQDLKINNIEVFNSDIIKELKQGRESEAIKKLGRHYRVVANIPYYLTGLLIRLLLESTPQPENITLMVQKEVAQRIVEAPPKMSLLSVAVQYYANPKVLFYVSKNCFWPQPKIDSAIINLETKKSHTLEAQLFFKIIKAGFSCPRKQLLNNLSSGLKISKEKLKNRFLENGFNPLRRAESLSVEEWENLLKIIYPAKS